MKQILFFICGFFLTYAQFTTLRYAEMPIVGTWQLRSYIDTANFDPGAGGANQVWDFTGVNFLQGSDTLYWRSPSGLPGDTAFPGANLHQNHFLRFLGSSIPHNLFIRKDSNAFVILGFHQPYTDLSYLIPGLFYPEQVYVNPTPDTLFVYPLNYGSTRSFPEVMQRMEVGSPPQDSFIIRRIQRQVELDGYGALQFFGVTYPEVVRVKVITQVKDTSYRDSSGTYIVDYIQNSVSTTYYWFAKDSGLVFLYEETTGSIYNRGFGTFPYSDKWGALLRPSSPVTSLPVGISNSSKFLILHDPVTKTLKFEPSLKSLVVFDLSGKVWYSTESYTPIGQFCYELLPTNLYLIEAESVDGVKFFYKFLRE